MAMVNPKKCNNNRSKLIEKHFVPDNLVPSVLCVFHSQSDDIGGLV